MNKYIDLKVQILAQDGNGKFPIKVSSGSNSSSDSFELPFALSDLAEFVGGIADTNRAIGTIAPAKGTGLASDLTNVEMVGAKLFATLFTAKTRDILAAASTETEHNENTLLRIRLAMDLHDQGMAAIASLPWEYMWHSGWKRSLFTSAKSTLVRTLEVSTGRSVHPVEGALNILVVKSNPTGSEPLQLEEEAKAIEGIWPADTDVNVDEVEPNIAAIAKKLGDAPYHVIHFMGHGDYSDDEGGTLILEDEYGDFKPVTGANFANLVGDEPLQLVFLNACKTGTSGNQETNPFAGVAASLIGAGATPAVIAMQFPISDRAAIRFSKTFYERILQGFLIDAAVGEGRKALKVEDSKEWGTPVLYLQAGVDGHLFGKRERDDPSTLFPEVDAEFEGLKAIATALQPNKPLIDKASEGAKKIGTMKFLHDQIHQLRPLIYEPLKDAMKNMPSEDAAVEVGRVSSRLRELIADTINKAPDPELMEIYFAGIKADLTNVQDQMNAAMDQLSGGPLGDAIFFIENIFNNELSRINGQLGGSVQALDLHGLVNLLEDTRDKLPDVVRQANGRKLDDDIQTLADCTERLDDRMKAHNQWQKVESWLNGLEIELTNPGENRQRLWRFLKTDLDKIWSDLDKSAPDDYTKAESSFSEAIASDTTLKIRLSFIPFESWLRSRYREIDRQLLAECGTLGTIGVGLGQIVMKIDG